MYASGGYYRDEKGLEGLREEVQRYVDRGHDAVKVKTGRLPPAEEAERVRVARETIGDERVLMVDANGAWSNKPEALRTCRAIAEYDPYFVEEPVMPDSVSLMAEVNDALEVDWRDDLLTRSDPLIEDGYVAVPESPGLGVELDEDVAAEHAKGEGDLWS